MKRTNPAVDLAGMASSARPCAPSLAMRGDFGAPDAIPATPSMKRNGLVDTRTGVRARRQRILTT